MARTAFMVLSGGAVLSQAPGGSFWFVMVMALILGALGIVLRMASSLR